MAKAISAPPPNGASSPGTSAVIPVASTGFAPLVPPGTSAGGTEVVLCADFDRYGTRLVTGGADHRLRMYERVDDRWELVDVWRAHNGMVLDVKFSPLPSSAIPLFASTGEDLRLKIWASDPTAPISSGRRFYCSFSQSAGHGAVAYVALAIAAPAIPIPDLLMAVVTRDGIVSLLEPVPEIEQRAAAGASMNGAHRRQGQDWRELDQIYAADGPVARGTETCFRLAFQPFPTSTSYMGPNSPTGSAPISLAVSSLNDVRIYPIIPPSSYSADASAPSAFASSPNVSSGSYRFGSPLAVLPAGNGRLVRDVAWSPAAHRRSAWIAAAAADGTVRVYDVAPPRSARRSGQTPTSQGSGGVGSEGTAGTAGPAKGSIAVGERMQAAPTPASTLTASLSRASQRSNQQPQTQSQSVAPSLYATSAFFPGAPSNAHVPTSHPSTEGDGSAPGNMNHGRGPSGEATPSEPAGAMLSPMSSGAPRVETKLVAELEHPGVWRVSWVRTGAMVVSIGDSGQGRIWGPGVGGAWMEFAEFGAGGEGE